MLAWNDGCIWKVFCCWAGLLDQCSQRLLCCTSTCAAVSLGSPSSCCTNFPKASVLYSRFYVTRISWSITFLAVLSTESGGKHTLLIKMNQNPEAQTWLFLSFESNAIFSNCVIPLVCWVQSEEDELELVSLGCCLLRDSKMLEMSFTTAF